MPAYHTELGSETTAGVPNKPDEDGDNGKIDSEDGTCVPRIDIEDHCLGIAWEMHLDPGKWRRNSAKQHLLGDGRQAGPFKSCETSYLRLHPQVQLAILYS